MAEEESKERVVRSREIYTVGKKEMSGIGRRKGAEYKESSGRLTVRARQLQRGGSGC